MSADKLYPYGLPLGHRGLGLPTEYDYHQAMAQHAAGLNAGNNSIHPAMSQIQMMPTGLNLSMNSGNHSMNSGMQSNVNNTHHLSHVSGATSGGGKMKNKKMKVNKDGIPAPKRATTAYINFTQWYREDQKRNGRQIPKIGEFGKECACKWNNMTGEEKQPFLEVAARDRERYRKEMAIFKPARDVNKPKRPGTAFMLFMGDLRKEMAGKEPEGGVAALAKLGGERWRSMTDDDKRKYVEMQGEEKVRYEANMEEYRKKELNLVPICKLSEDMQIPDTQLQSIANIPAVSLPQAEEPSNDSSDSLDLSSAAASQLPQLSQATSNSGSSTPSPTETPTPASQSNSASPPPPTLSPGPTDSSTSESPNSSMAALSSLTNPMSLSHAMAMGYAQHTLSNFAHASGMLMSNPNYNQVHTTMPSSAYLSSSNPNYNQAHMQGPYNWN